eukprot:4026076-Pleurochrysis_carterae.AAC.1
MDIKPTAQPLLNNALSPEICSHMPASYSSAAILEWANGRSLCPRRISIACVQVADQGRRRAAVSVPAVAADRVLSNAHRRSSSQGRRFLGAGRFLDHSRMIWPIAPDRSARIQGAET